MHYQNMPPKKAATAHQNLRTITEASPAHLPNKKRNSQPKTFKSSPAAQLRQTATLRGKTRDAVKQRQKISFCFITQSRYTLVAGPAYSRAPRQERRLECPQYRQLNHRQRSPQHAISNGTLEAVLGPLQGLGQPCPHPGDRSQTMLQRLGGLETGERAPMAR